MRFTRDDVDRFSIWSADRNPLHVDAEFARHTHFGQPIVHGILTVLGALQEARLKPGTTALVDGLELKPDTSDQPDTTTVVPGFSRASNQVRRLELEFRRAVLVDDEYAPDRSDTSTGFTVTLNKGGDVVLTIRAETASREQEGDADLSWAHALAAGDMRFATAIRETPASRSIDELQHGVEVTGEYPAVPAGERWTGAGVVSPVQARVLALCSYITGMELPGLRSLFTRVSVEFHRVDAADGPLRYRARTRRCDAQFRLLETELQVATPDGTPVATATLRSYVPFSPSVPDLEELARRLTPSAARLQGKVALVIGGSRGLGADIVSSLALAGCDVYATARHQDSATAQLQHSLAARDGRIELLEGDAGDRDWCQSTRAALQARHGRLDLLVLNACAPPSHTRLGGSTSPQEDAYLRENLALVESPLGTFVELLHSSGGAVVYLSSSFVTHSPAGFGRYVALKQAGEAMLHTAVHEYPRLSSLIVRPPPLQTRWNDTPAGVAGAIPADRVASHVVNRLADTWQAGHVEMLSEFPPFATRAPSADHAAHGDAAFTVRIAASFTTDPLLPGLRFWLDELDLDAEVELAPYGQILQSLLDPHSLFASKGKGCNVVLLRLRDWLRELPDEQASALDFVRTYLRETASEFEQAIRSHRGRAASDTLLVLCPSYGGASSAEHIVLRQTEAELAAALGNVPGLTIVTASDYHSAFAVNEDEVGDALRDEIAHIPYRDAYLHVLATLVARHVYRRIAPLRKVVVADCDNTLWRGVVGEVGPEGLEFDEGHRALHERLITLSSNGVLVCLCSKNEEADVWRVFDTRADFALRREHVTAAMINWLPKSQNLRTLAARLNLGIDSFIFIDDNPVECAEVRTSCPEVLTLQWPPEPERAIALLRQAWELEATAGTKEDQRRTQMYRDELQRQTLRTGAMTFEEFLENLQLVVEFATLTEEHVRRAAQLTLRTNQFNFTTKRRDESELQALVAGGRHDIRTVRVRDRFGDYGLVGLVIVERGDDAWVLDTFLLSCRVLGRGVEHQIVSEVGQMAVAAGAHSVRMRVDFTARNTPARMFLESIVAPELRTVDATGLESALPATLLAAARFEPTADADVTADEGDADPVAAPQAIDFGKVRDREEQLAHASSALSTMTGLQAAVEGRGDVAVIPTLVSGDIADVVYRAFATALRMPVETIKSVDRLEGLGCDSLRIVEITVALRERFPWLPSTLLFEHRSVGEILHEIHALAGAEGSAGVDARPSPSIAAPGRSSASTDIAVVGMHVRCAGAQSPGELWDLLGSGRSGVKLVPSDRKYFLGRLNDTRPHWAGLLENPARFDAEFFGVSPREAEYMDPQLRLFLEVAWSAIEDAGYAGADHDPDTGVFVGVMYGDYGLRANRNETESPYRCWEGFSLANRLSQLLDFHGPSLAVDTACSSSGTALHLACRALTAGDCRVAIVGGVNLILDPDRFASLGRLGILSAKGFCEPFGADADGTVLGEGAGVVVLRPLDEAQRRGDRIYGVIKGTGLSTGNGTVGFTAPNPQAQADAIRRSIEAAGVDPRTVTYVETHGTGTALGDPIEVRGLTLGYGSPALQDPTLQIDHRCSLGSIKPNVGHMEAGAGVVGLIKVLLQLHHRTLVPSITSESPNPQIPFRQTPFAVQRVAEPWEPLTITSGGRQVAVPRRAGLSSFGVGGANAHVIVEEAPSTDAQPRSTGDRSAHLVTLSARTDESLQRRILGLEQHVAATPQLAVADLAYSLNAGHQHFDRRVAVIARCREELSARLEAAGADGEARGVTRGALSLSTPPPKVGFLFTGQGSQHAGMGRQLYDTQPVFRDALDRCAAIFDSLLSRPLLELLFAEKNTAEAELLNQTGFTQPALFAFEYALATLWQSWGIHPAVVLGHSVGEIGAMCVAGGVSLGDGLKLIAARGHLMQALPPGGMMTSVMADEDLVLEAIAGRDEVTIAAVNAPRQVVISGAGTAVAEVTARLTADGIKTKALTVSHAFHSPLMKPMLAEYERVVRTIRFTPPRIPFVSCVDGALVSREVTQPEYWLRQVMDPVRFAAGMRVLDAQGVTAYLEIGPQPVLLGMGRQCLDRSGMDVEWLPSLKADTDAWQTLLGSLSTLYVKGAPVDWKGFDAPYQRQRVAVPAYAFREKEFWLRGLESPSDPRNGARPAASATPARQAPGPQLYEVRWQQQASVADAVPEAASFSWVIFADSQGVGERLAHLLTETGALPTVVTSGTHFAQVGPRAYHIDSANPDDYARVWSSVTEQTHKAVRAVHLWGLDAPSLDRPTANAASNVTPPLETLLLLSRAIAASGRTTPTLWCVTRGATAIDASASGSIALEQAPLWGFGRTVALEHPELWGGLIDLAPDEGGADLRPLINEIVAAGPEDQIALRGPRRYAPRLERREDGPYPPVTLRAEAVYLVTGGVGALGSHVARWLVTRGARHLVLASRRGGADPQARSAAQALEALGATVTVVAADISRTEGVDALMTVIGELGAPLRGVVHAAGIDVPTPMRELTVDGLRAVMSPKAMGGWLLHERTRELPLDFFVLFSSVASVLGSQGRAHYGAANAFLDALALERRLLGLPGLAVNWGPWRGGGMASDEHLRGFERVGNRGLDPDAALHLLDRLMSTGDAQVSAIDIDWDQFRQFYEARRQHPLVSGLGTLRDTSAASATVQPTRGGEGSTPAKTDALPEWVARLVVARAPERQALLELALRQEVAEMLGFDSLEDVPSESNFYQLGMDSLMTAELVARLRKRLGMSCSGLVLDYPNVRDLAPRLLEALHESLAAAGTSPVAPSTDVTPSAARANLADPPADGVRNGFSNYSPDDDPQVFAFQTSVFPDRNPEWIVPRWRWMFVDSAKRLGRAPQVWLYHDADRVVGQMGAIPVRLKIGGRHRDTAWLVETMVLESHRSQAIGSRMMLQSHEDVPFSLSLGQSPEMRDIQDRLGWKQVAQLRIAQLLIRPENVLKRKLGTPGAWAAGLGLRASAVLRDVFRDRSQMDVREIHRFDDRHDALWEDMAHDLTCAVVRDASFLNWKYVDQPGQTFIRLELVEGGRARGVVVLTLREPDAVYAYRRAFLVDIVGPLRDVTLLHRLIQLAMSAAAEHGADSLVCMHLHANLTRALKASGFRLRKPTRLLLIDTEGLSEPELALVIDPDNWHLTQGDSDIDRPGVS